MKGIFCAKCFTIRSLSVIDREPVICQCGNLRGWWIDGKKGIARFLALDREAGFMIGWNNRYLHGIVDLFQQGAGSDAMVRELHKLATDAPGFHFDKDRKACWSIILRPGMSSDTAWATEDEQRAAGLIPESDG